MKLLIIAVVLASCALLDVETKSVAELEVQLAKAQLRRLATEPLGGNAVRGKSGGDSLKDHCTCPTFNECVCCGDHEFAASEKGAPFKTKVCVTFQMEDFSSSMKLKVKVGPLTVIDNYFSLDSFQKMCTKMEEYDKIEFCSGIKVEKTDTRLRVCSWVQTKILGIFEHPFILPCLNVDKGKGMSLDENMDDYKETGIKLNLVSMWNKFKGWLHL